MEEKGQQDDPRYSHLLAIRARSTMGPPNAAQDPTMPPRPVRYLECSLEV